MDTYTIESTDRTTPKGNPVFALRRNGVVVATGTRQTCERERDLRIKTGRNPLAGMGGEFQRRASR